MDLAANNLQNIVTSMSRAIEAVVEQGSGAAAGPAAVAASGGTSGGPAARASAAQAAEAQAAAAARQLDGAKLRDCRGLPVPTASGG